MASPLMLNGHIDNRDRVIEDLRARVRQLEEDVRFERARLVQSETGVSELRACLSPLYSALRKVFAEIDAIAPGDAATPSTAVQSQKWQMWKNRFPGRGAEVIDLLLVQKQMNTKQLSGALRCDPRTLAQVIYKLNQVGIIQKNGNMFSLKEI